MHIHKFFPKVVAEYNDVCSDRIPAMIAECEELSKNCGTRSSTSLNVNSSHTSIQTIHRLPAFKPLAKQILEHAREFIDEYGYYEVLKERVFITNMWFNISDKGNYLYPHTHPGTKFSGAYYLESHPDHTICFHDMFRTILEQPMRPTELGTDVRILPCTPGTMYLFHSDFVHSIAQQNQDCRKIVISFNISFKDGPEMR